MVQGVISKVNSKDWGTKKFWSFALSGQDGWYNNGMKRPPSEGTSIRFNFKTNAKGYNDVDGGIEIVTDGPVAPAGSASNVGAALTRQTGNSGNASGAYWDRKETRDIHNDELREIGASRNTAIAIIDLMIKHEAVKLPTTAKREGFIWELLDRYTNKLRGKTTEEKNEATLEKAVQETLNETASEEWN